MKDFDKNWVVICRFKLLIRRKNIKGGGLKVRAGFLFPKWLQDNKNEVICPSQSPDGRYYKLIIVIAIFLYESQAMSNSCYVTFPCRHA